MILDNFGTIKNIVNANAADPRTPAEVIAADFSEFDAVTAAGNGNSWVAEVKNSTGTESWSSQINLFDLNDALQIQHQVQRAGGDLIKFYDTEKSHPYDELDITKDSTGRITAAEVTPDPAVAAVASVAQVLGSAIGRALAPNNQLAQLAAGTLAGTVASAIGQKFAQVLSASLSDNAAQISLDGVFNGFGLNLGSAAAGSVASLITAELGTALGLHGYGAQLFDAGVGGLASQVATQLVQKGGLSALNAINWTEALGGAAASLGGAVGSILGNQIVHAETQAGAIGGQLLGAVGSVIGASYVLGQSLGLLLDFAIPGIGSLIGTVLGTLLGDAFGPGTPHPASTHILDWSGAHYTDYLYTAVEGGQTDTSKAMADAATGVVNSYLDAVQGAALDHGKQVMIGYRTDGDPSHPYFSGWLPGVTPFATASEAVFAAALDVLHNTEVIGGDLLLKRAHTNSAYSDSSVLAGDLQVAQDYENYLNNREAINAVMAANPASAFTAGWIATFARVNDLGLNHANASDFLGGLVGWLDSVKKAGLVFDGAGVTYNQVGSTALIDIKVANGIYVPGALAAFADQMSQSSDASGATLHFVISNGLVPLGFHAPSSAALVSGTWQVSGADSNVIWFGSGNAPNEYHDNNPGQSNDILIGGGLRDSIYAGNGWNFVDAGDDNDGILTGSGNDILHGGRGDDYLRGGGGDDSYTFSRGDGADEVFDDVTVTTTTTTWNDWIEGTSDGGVISHHDPVTTTTTTHSNGGADTLAFGPGISIADVSVRGNGPDVIVAVKDPAHPGVPFGQLADRITLTNWGDPLDRVETLSFADGAVLSIADSAALAALRVPFGATLSHGSVAENSANGTVVGTVTGYDLDTDARLHYAWAPNGDAGGRFAINAVTGAITVANGNALDYEAAHSYQVTVRTLDDASYSFDKTFTIALTDVNEAFTGNSGDNTFTYTGGHATFNGGNGGFDVVDMSHFTSAVLINLTLAGTQVWTTDAASQQQGWWRPLVDLSGGVENAVGANAETRFVGDAQDNRFSWAGGHDSFEGGAGFDTLDMSRLTSAVLINLNVAGAQVSTTDAATLQQGSWRALVDLTDSAENVIGANADTSFVGDAHDNRFTWAGGHDTFEGGAGVDTLDMSRLTGAMLVNLNVSGTQVWTTDAATLQQGAWRPLVDLTDGVESVIGASGNTNFVGDNNANSFTGGAGNDVFDGEGGNDVLNGGGGNDSYLFGRGNGADTVLDGGGADTLAFGPGISVADISEQGNGADVIVEVKDPAHPGVPYAQLADRITLTNWTDPLHRVEKLVFADGTTLSIADSAALAALHVPFGAALWGNSVAENAASGALVGTVTGYDFDADVRLHYAWAPNGDAGGRFAINALTGEISVANGFLLDYEAAHSYQITVRTLDDASYAFDKTFTIALTDVTEAPTGATLAGGTIAENSANGSLVGTVTGVDPDPHAVFSYSLTGDAAGRFAIDSSTGAITVANAAALDYESATAHGIVVRAADQAGLFVDRPFTIQVTDMPGLTLNGDGGNNVLTGSPENDTLDGGPGADAMSGGPGNDVYVVDNAGDTVSENAGEGIDTVRSSVSIALAANVENLTLSGAASINGAGNAADNIITGNTGDNVLTGSAGADDIQGGAGLDTAVYSGNRADYTIFWNSRAHNFVIADLRSGSPDGTDTVDGVERFQFADHVTDSVQEFNAINHSPLITSNGGSFSATVAVMENSTAVTTVTATDQDPGTVLAWSIAGGADQFQFRIDPSTHAVSFINAPDFEASTDSDHNNSYIVQVRASDGVLSDTQTIVVNVTDAFELLKPTGDFNGDGTSDVLWRNNATGHVGIWEMHNNVQSWHDLGGSGVDHKVAGIGDFNGDGTADVLWRNDSTGHVGLWEMHNDVQSWRDLGDSGADHKVVGIGDFNTDGTSDILWRNDATGHTGLWEMHNNVPTWHDLGSSGIDHKVVGVGDFNRDGTSDILWRNDSSGHVAIWQMHNDVPSWLDLGGSGTDHKVAGVGDFNGDGTSDILWRNDATGHVGIWEMHNDVQTWRDLGSSGVEFKVAGIGDYNGDGTSDVFWRNNSDGHVGIWEMHNNVAGWHDLGLSSGVDHAFIV